MFLNGPCGQVSFKPIDGTIHIGHPVQRPLALHRVMLSPQVIAYYGLIRDSRPFRCLIFFVQRIFALRPSMGWRRELPQFAPHICSIVPSLGPRRSKRLHMAVSSPFTLAFALLTEAQLTHLRHAGLHLSGVTRLQSSFYATARWIARPSPARTFTFELSPPGSPQNGVEYNYTGKQSIPVTGLTPARYAALWAANQDTKEKQKPGFRA